MRFRNNFRALSLRSRKRHAVAPEFLFDGVTRVLTGPRKIIALIADFAGGARKLHRLTRFQLQDRVVFGSGYVESVFSERRRSKITGVELPFGKSTVVHEDAADVTL